jgi:diacylglycerol kinase (ATP)
MRRKIIYLVNPIAGTAKKDDVLKLIEQKHSQHQIPYSIHATNPNGNYINLKDTIIAEAVTDVVIVGGDGTVNQVVNSLQDLPINFGIVPMGSGNGLAYAAKISAKPSEAIDIIIKGNTQLIDACNINNQFSCMLSGIGFDAQVAEDFAAKNSRGLFTYTQQSILHFFKAHPYQFQITVDEFSFFTEAYFISIANSNQFGNHFTIAPNASLTDGLLDIVIVQKMNKAKLPFAILRQIRGNNKLQNIVHDMGSKNILYFQTESIAIQNLKLAPLHIDGEPTTTAPTLQASIVKGCFKLLMP